ncbi:MAG: hypothetical protein R3C28_05760 [Pirellulaceae bacterium]
MWLSRPGASGSAEWFVDNVEFGATDTGVSLARWPNASGDLFPSQSNSLGAVNSGPATSALIISEIHYNPAASPAARIWAPTGWSLSGVECQRNAVGCQWLATE